MLKPNIEDISTIINKCKELSLRKEELKNKKFLTPVQQGVFNAQNKPLWLYIWRLSDEVQREHFYNCNIPIQYTRAKSGRFVVTHDNGLELYSENRDGTPVHDGDRVELDEELLVLALKDKAHKKRQPYWIDNIQPLINVIDKLLFPFWDYLRSNGSWGAGEQSRIETAVQSQDPSALDELIRELEKVRYKVEIESNQKVVQQQAQTDIHSFDLEVLKQTIEQLRGLAKGSDLVWYQNFLLPPEMRPTVYKVLESFRANLDILQPYMEYPEVKSCFQQYDNLLRKAKVFDNLKKHYESRSVAINSHDTTRDYVRVASAMQEVIWAFTKTLEGLVAKMPTITKTEKQKPTEARGGEKPAETGEKDEPCDPLSWMYEMYDSLVWKEFQDSGEQWVGPFDPILRFDEDTESLTHISTLKDYITHLKKILPYWIEYQFVSPKSDILAEMTHTIRCWLIKVRHDSNEKLPPIPPDLIGMVDWIPDVEEILAGGTTRKEIDYTAQDRAEIGRGPTVEPTMPGGTEQKTPSVKERPDTSPLTKGERQAYESYEYAMSQKPELADKTDDDVYNWLKEAGLPEYELPESCETWKRYVRHGRWVNGTQKTSPRKGRTGRSITKVDQIEYTSSQRPDEAD